MLDSIFSSLRSLPIPPIAVRGTAEPLDPTLDVNRDDPDLIAPPWHVRGRATLEIAQYPLESVRPYVPADIDIVQTWPGYTVGAVAFIAYDDTPVGPYNEVVIAPALVRHRDDFSLWVAAIDVDSESSRRNGRFNWGLPKKIRQFEYAWQPHGAQLKVKTADSAALIEASYSESPLSDIDLPEWLESVETTLKNLTVPLNTAGYTLITRKGSSFYRTATRLEGKFVPVTFQITTTAPSDSPYTVLNVRKPLVGVSFERFEFDLQAPVLSA